MTQSCNPATYRVERYNIRPSVELLLKAAYAAVNRVIYKEYVSTGNSRHVIKAIWQQGHECLKKETRHYPVVVGRALVMYYMRYRLMYTLKAIGAMFGKDHTTIIHSTRLVESSLTSKFDNEIATAYKRFLREIR